MGLSAGFDGATAGHSSDARLPGAGDLARVDEERFTNSEPVTGVGRVIGAERATAAERIVIVGASLAGLRAAERLRLLGHTGRITLVGDETLAPYDRPPLSKSMLTRSGTPIPHLAEGPDLDLNWRLGCGAVGLDRSSKTVVLSDGSQVDYDRLLIATGRRARPWANLDESVLDGVLTLRSAVDGADLRDRLARKPSRVVIIGAGFIGSEVASACRALGLSVTVIARGLCPLDGALGASVGTVATALYEENGVDLRRETSVVSIAGDADGHARAVELDDGTTIAADVVVVATGSLPNVEWLEGSGLDIEGGVAVDEYLTVLDEHGLVCSDIFAAGDVTRWAHPLSGDRLLSIEHWGNAVEQGRHAATNILAETPQAFVEIPRFWSTMFGVNIKSIGVPSLGDEVVVVQGSLTDRRGVAVYGREGRCVAAVSVDAPRELEFFESMVETGDVFPPRIRVPDWALSTPPLPVPARFPTRGTTRPRSSDGATSGTLLGVTDALGLALHAPV